MKFYLVLLILICGGGWYYYDIHYAKSSFFKKGSEPQAVESALDSKQLELEQKAKELFPTKVSERAAWVERQMAAYNQISKVRDGISPEIAASIRKFADRKYPLDYDKQLDVVSKQELAAIGMLQTISSAKLGASETAEILSAASKNMEGDYVSQSYAIQKIIDAYNSIKSKATMMSERDYNILRRKAMDEIAVSPENALKEFERQYLARHNFLTKTISPAWGDLRSGIEDIYPEDFVAQLAELDKRIQGKLAGGGASVISLASEKTDSRVDANKSLYPCMLDDGGYFCVFASIKGKDFLVVPSLLIQKIGEDSFSFSRIGLSGTGDIHMSTNSPLAIVDVPKGSEFESIRLADGKGAYSKGTFDVMLLGFDDTAKKIVFDASLVDGELRYSANVEAKLGLDMLGNLLVIDSKSGVLIGFFAQIPDSGVKGYRIGDYKDFAYFKNKVLGTNDKAMGNSNIDFKKIYMAPINSDSERRFKMVFFDDIEGWQKFSSSKNKEQLALIDKMRWLNFGVCDFMLENTYANALENPLFRKVAEKHKGSFFKTVNTAKSVFMSDYLSNLHNINFTGIGSAMFAKKDLFDSFYYQNRVTAMAQLGLWEKTQDLLKGMVEHAMDPKMLHADLFDNFEKGYYKANLKVNKAASGPDDSRVNDSMGKVKFRLKSK